MNRAAGDLDAALAAIDDANREDPAGLAYEHAMTVAGWVERLRPDASDALRLAARAQHIRRWQIPRDSYPRNRPGYLRWRKDLQQFHAEQAGAILADCGFAEGFIRRVQAMMRKQDLEHDAETRTLEDGLCLAFIERQLAGFSTQHSDAKLQRILRRTWAKMSPDGRQAALNLALPAEVRALLERSLAGAGEAAPGQR